MDLSCLSEGDRVTVDTAPIIYLLEGHPVFLIPYLPLFKSIEAGKYHAFVSVVTLAEVLAGPLKQGNEILADRYYRALTSSGHWQLQVMDAELSFMAARIRSQYGLKLPDAIQLATAIQTDSTALVTHDRDFSSVEEMQILGI